MTSDKVFEGDKTDPSVTLYYGDEARQIALELIAEWERTGASPGTWTPILERLKAALAK
jgi:hypothetical protein